MDEKIILNIPKGFPPINAEITKEDIERLKLVPKAARTQAFRAIMTYRLRELVEWDSWINAKIDPALEPYMKKLTNMP